MIIANNTVAVDGPTDHPVVPADAPDIAGLRMSEPRVVRGDDLAPHLLELQIVVQDYFEKHGYAPVLSEMRTLMPTTRSLSAVDNRLRRLMKLGYLQRTGRGHRQLVLLQRVEVTKPEPQVVSGADLAPRMLQVHMIVQNFIEEYGYAPINGEVRALLTEAPRLNTVQHHIQRLVELGYLQRQGVGARNLVLLKKVGFTSTEVMHDAPVSELRDEYRYAGSVSTLGVKPRAATAPEIVNGADLSPMQQKVLLAIQDHMELHGEAPLVREVHALLPDAPVLRVVYTHMSTLEKRGYLTRIGSWRRNLVLLKKIELPPTTSPVVVTGEGLRPRELQVHLAVQNYINMNGQAPTVKEVQAVLTEALTIRTVADTIKLLVRYGYLQRTNTGPRNIALLKMVEPPATA